MKSIQFYILLLACSLTLCQCNSDASQAIKQSTEAWSLVWSDDFNQDGPPDSTKWTYSIGDGCPVVCGWGNNESQYYTDQDLRNARVDDGLLIIEAHQEQTETKPYSSAKLTTLGSKELLYGKIEVRAKLPSGRGTWPAIWMMPAKDTYGGWPKSGEIDIMEHVGYKVDSIFGTIHCESFNHILGTDIGGEIYDPTVENTFHTYSIEWDENQISWFMDGKLYQTFDNQHKTYKEWPFDQPFYLILNLAVGGNWGGKHGIDQTIWPQQLQIDYVKIFEHTKS